MCSALAVSVECDQMTGQCVCQQGAVGLKCDDCDFGYFGMKPTGFPQYSCLIKILISSSPIYAGKVPDCEPCHDCFFDWFDTINSLSSQVSSLQNAVNALFTDNYDGYNVSSVQSEVDSLLQQLAKVNQSLSAITLQQRNVAELESFLAEVSGHMQIHIVNKLHYSQHFMFSCVHYHLFFFLSSNVSQLNASLVVLTEAVTRIQQQLDLATVMINRANAFNGTVNGTSARDIRQQVLMYNTTVGEYAANAHVQLNALHEDQVQAYNAWMQAENLNMTAKLALINLSHSINNTELAASIVDQFQDGFLALMSNLTRLDMDAKTLSGSLQTLSESVMNASGEVQFANTSVLDLLAEIEERKVEADLARDLARQLNDSVEAAWAAAQESMDSASELLVRMQYLYSYLCIAIGRGGGSVGQ